MARIVVGIDPSDNAVRALRWAVEEAQLRDAHLELVHAVPRPDVLTLPAVPTLPTNEELVDAGEQLLARVQASVAMPGLTVTAEARVGSAADLLCGRAQGADLIVVGARGLGGFRGLLLGSVTQQVVAHAPCPVVIVTPADRSDGAGAEAVEAEAGDFDAPPAADHGTSRTPGEPGPATAFRGGPG